MVLVMSTKPNEAGRRILGDYLTEKQLAAELNFSTRQLKRWRARGIGPPYTRIGRSVRYRIEGVRQWMIAQERSPRQNSL